MSPGRRATSAFADLLHFKKQSADGQKSIAERFGINVRRFGATRWRDASGFTLIEVLIAFCVMATLLSVLYRGVVTMRQGANAFDEHTDREIVARAVLDSALADRTMKPGTYHGTRDGRRWTIVARNIDVRGLLPPPADDGTKSNGPGQPATPGAAADKPGAAADKPEWTTQRLLVRLESPGLPLEVETLRLVRVEK